MILLAACEGGVDPLPETDAPFNDSPGEALVPGPDCTSTDLCVDSLVRPSCFAAAREANFAYETFQAFDVPRAGAYSFVRFNARRAFGSVPGGDLRVQLREFSPAGPWTAEAATVIATTTIQGSAIPRTSTSLVARFSPPVTLGLANGPRRRYALVFDVPASRLTVAIGCASDTAAFPGGTSAVRKILSPSTTPAPGPWRSSVRAVSFAIGFTANSTACPPTAPVPACDDGNTAGGDGCAADCTIESGYACTGLPSSCTDLDECALGTDACSDVATCTNTVGGYTCECPPGSSGSGLSCAGAGGHGGTSLAASGGTRRSAGFRLQLTTCDVQGAPVKASSPNFQLRGGFVGATGDLP